MRALQAFLATLLVTFTLSALQKEGDQVERATKWLENIRHEAGLGRRPESKMRQFFRDDFIFDDCSTTLSLHQTADHLFADRHFSYTIGQINNGSNANYIHFEVDVKSDICAETEKLRFEILRMFDYETETYYYAARQGWVTIC